MSEKDPNAACERWFADIIANFPAIKRTRMDAPAVLDALENLIADLQVWVMVVDDQDTPLLWNSAAEDLTGYLAEEVVGNRHFWKQLNPDADYWHTLTKRITENLGSHRSLSFFEAPVRTKGGETRTLSFSVRRILRKDGSYQGYIAIGHDISDIIKVREEAERMRHELFSVIDAIPEPLFLTDEEGRIERLNEAASAIAGNSGSSFFGRRCYEVFHGRHDFIRNCPLKAILHRAAQPDSAVIHLGDRVFTESVTPRFDRNGQLVGGIHYFEEITSLLTAQAEWNACQEHIRSLTDHIGDIIFLLDQEGRIEFISPGAVRFAGVGTTLAGKRLTDLVCEEDRAMLDRKISAALLTGIGYTAEYRLADASGVTRWFEDVARARRDHMGRVNGVAGVLRDVTGRHDAFGS